ncbi:MAG: DinB family protein, partial [Actinomycetota bacterium]
MVDDIVPDTKNWTWVLEKRCDDCGFDASVFDASQTGPAVRDLSERWQVVLARPDVSVRPRPAVWSPLEYGCHVRDVFRLFDERVALMVSEDDPR